MHHIPSDPFRQITSYGIQHLPPNIQAVTRPFNMAVGSPPYSTPPPASSHDGGGHTSPNAASAVSSISSSGYGSSTITSPPGSSQYPAVYRTPPSSNNSGSASANQSPPVRNLNALLMNVILKPMVFKNPGDNASAEQPPSSQDSNTEDNIENRMWRLDKRMKQLLYDYPRQKFCRMHVEMTAVDAVCITCQSLVCSKCVLVSNSRRHDDHIILSLDKFMLVYKSHVGNMIDQHDTEIAMLRQSIDRVYEMKRALDREQEWTRLNIFEGCYGTDERAQHNMCVEVDNFCKSITGAVNAHIRQLNMSLNTCKNKQLDDLTLLMGDMPNATETQVALTMLECMHRSNRVWNMMHCAPREQHIAFKRPVYHPDGQLFRPGHLKYSINPINFKHSESEFATSATLFEQSRAAKKMEDTVQPRLVTRQMKLPAQPPNGMMWRDAWFVDPKLTHNNFGVSPSEFLIGYEDNVQHEAQNGAQYGMQCGAQYGAPNGMQNGAPNGVQYGSQYGALNGMQNGNGSQYGAQNGMQNGTPNGVQYGWQNGNGLPNGAQYGMQNGMQNGVQQYGIQYGAQNGGQYYGAQSGAQNGGDQCEMPSTILNNMLVPRNRTRYNRNYVYEQPHRTLMPIVSRAAWERSCTVRTASGTAANQAVWNHNQLIRVRLDKQPKAFFGANDAEMGPLNRPWGVCVNSLGHIITADRRGNRIQVYMSDGMPLFHFGSRGCGHGEFDLPTGVCTDYLNNIYVVDKDNHRVQVFNMVGKFLYTFGSYGSLNGQFDYPWGIAVNRNLEVVVTDSRNSRIQMFSQLGVFVKTLQLEAEETTRHRGATMPRGVCFTPDGSIIVSDFENHRLLLVNKELTKVAATTQCSSMYNFMSLKRPSGVCCDDYGRVIVADSKNNRVMIFSPELEFLYVVSIKWFYANILLGMVTILQYSNYLYFSLCR